MAQMRADSAQDRLDNIEMHKANQKWMQEESRTNRELAVQNRAILDLLLKKGGVEVPTLPAAEQSPLLLTQGQPSSSNISNASSPSQAVPMPPPLPVQAPMPPPPPPTDDVAVGIPSTQPEDIAPAEMIRLELEAGQETTAEAGTEQNLSRDDSKVEAGSDDLPTEDVPAGSAQQ